jgi:hypothetical protein
LNGGVESGLDHRRRQGRVASIVDAARTLLGSSGLRVASNLVIRRIPFLVLPVLSCHLETMGLLIEADLGQFIVAEKYARPRNG